MKKILILVLAVSFFTLSGCEYEETTSTVEQKSTEENQSRLLKVQPPVKLDKSLERSNINKRTLLWNDENKISYVYLVSYGKVMAFYTIKGKVSSVNSQITNPEQLKWIDGYRTGGPTTLPSPAEDGSYGTNGDGIFFFTTEGVYVEWAGEYMLADQPLILTTQPQLVREIK